MTDTQPDPEERRKFWKDHIENWNKSKLTQTDYCKQNDLIVHRFTYWKRRFVPENQANISFVPLQLSSNLPVFAGKSALNLFTPNGFRIEVTSGFDPATLKRLIITVQAL